MQEFLTVLLKAVITATVPVVATYGIKLIRQAAENIAAKTEDAKAKGYIAEIAQAITDAVATTSQTYVDALKQNGAFTAAAQAQAAKKALSACIASISPAAQRFIESTYGDITEYLKNKIEAEVRRQKNELGTTIGLPAAGETSADVDTIVAAVQAAISNSEHQQE